MSTGGDLGAKRLIGLDAAAWIAWLLGIEVSVGDLLDTEFPGFRRQTDVLLRASTPDEPAFLVLIERQTTYDPTMPRRMNLYAALAEERHGLPVYPILVNFRRPPRRAIVAPHYESRVLGLQARREYRIINLWERDVEEAFHERRAILLPFVPALNGGQDERQVRRALAALRARRIGPEFEALLAFFVRLCIGRELSQQLVEEGIDMTPVTRSFWDQATVDQSEYETTHKDLLLVLTARFGPAAGALGASLREFSTDQLRELLANSATDASLAEFAARVRDPDSSRSSAG